MIKFLVSIMPVLSKILIAFGILVLMIGFAQECTTGATPPTCKHVTRERTTKNIHFDVDSLLSAYVADTIMRWEGSPVEYRWRWDDETMLVVDSVESYVFYSFKKNDYIRCSIPLTNK